MSQLKVKWLWAALVIFAGIGVCLLSGCASTPTKDYYKGYEDCAGKVSGVFEYIRILEKEQDHCFKKSYYEDQISNLNYENAELRATLEFNERIRKECPK